MREGVSNCPMIACYMCTVSASFCPVTCLAKKQLFLSIWLNNSTSSLPFQEHTAPDETRCWTFSTKRPYTDSIEKNCQLTYPLLFYQFLRKQINNFLTNQKGTWNVTANCNSTTCNSPLVLNCSCNAHAWLPPAKSNND